MYSEWERGQYDGTVVAYSSPEVHQRSDSYSPEQITDDLVDAVRRTSRIRQEEQLFNSLAAAGTLPPTRRVFYPLQLLITVIFCLSVYPILTPCLSTHICRPPYWVPLCLSTTVEMLAAAAVTTRLALPVQCLLHFLDPEALLPTDATPDRCRCLYTATVLPPVLTDGCPSTLPACITPCRPC